eukprot:TRINITY_DN6102_c1_g1_i3.p5 TRINITY_DN6102_c1_g1~~TRINITY_DN6102_c1_g1_i3.p5  ORF type:complete len:108 (-),score=3.46 TRINITY_DN6102_c1_g1_i3:268-591(-)
MDGVQLQLLKFPVGKVNIRFGTWGPVRLAIQVLALKGELQDIRCSLQEVLQRLTDLASLRWDMQELYSIVDFLAIQVEEYTQGSPGEFRDTCTGPKDHTLCERSADC